MHGPEDAAELAAGWLRARIPARLRIIEDRLDTDHPDTAPHRITDPAQVLDHERGPIGLEDWPSVFVLPTESPSREFIELEEDGAEQYHTTYRMQVLAWVRGDSYESTSRLRLRYVLAIREALLERKSLRLPDGTLTGDPHATVAVDPRSIRESYGPLVDDEGRTIAGAIVTVDVKVRELLEPPPPVAVVERVDTDLRADTDVVDHPAFDS